jgi:hypothetical protein
MQITNAIETLDMNIAPAARAAYGRFCRAMGQRHDEPALVRVFEIKAVRSRANRGVLLENHTGPLAFATYTKTQTGGYRFQWRDNIPEGIE